MACSKYTLTNTGTTAVNFNYRRCDDSMWEYQVNLDPNQTKNIWLIDGTYDAAQIYETNIVLVNDGVYPLTPTPTPSVTTTNTPTVTQTPTPTSTVNNTPTPTSSPIVSFAYTNLYQDVNEIDACSHTPKNQTFYGLTKTTFSLLTAGDVIYQDAACTTTADFVFISDGVNYVVTNGSGSVLLFTSC